MTHDSNHDKENKMKEPINIDEYDFFRVGKLIIGMPTGGKYAYYAAIGWLKFPLIMLQKADKRISKQLDANPHLKEEK